MTDVSPIGQYKLGTVRLLLERRVVGAHNRRVRCASIG
jgi:hypothetical protein